MAATFACGKCGYTQLTDAKHIGQSFSCPQCGTVASVIEGAAPRTPPPAPSAVAPRSTVFDVASVAPQRRPSADSDRAGKVETRGERANSGASPEQENTARRAAMIKIQSKNLLLGLLLTLLFGGFGVFYASIIGGIICSILQLISLAIVFLTLGVGVVIALPLQVIFLIVTEVCINRHNKRLLNM